MASDLKRMTDVSLGWITEQSKTKSAAPVSQQPRGIGLSAPS